MLKWHSMAGNVEGEEHHNDDLFLKNLEEFYNENPKTFNRRVCKGPPTKYRWLAWKIVSKTKSLAVPGAYEELLTQELPEECVI
jgi:hypothetical protein